MKTTSTFLLIALIPSLAVSGEESDAERLSRMASEMLVTLNSLCEENARLVMTYRQFGTSKEEALRKAARRYAKSDGSSEVADAYYFRELELIEEAYSLPIEKTLAKRKETIERFADKERKMCTH